MTILFTDIVGSMALQTGRGDAAAPVSFDAHDAIVRREVADHGGVIAKGLAGGFMIVFDAVGPALACAAAIQRGQATHNDAYPDTAIGVRMGLNSGEAARQRGDFQGATVNAAARICAKAAGGEVLLSDVVRQLMVAAPGVPIRLRGRVQLKGFTERWRLHELLWEQMPARAEPRPPPNVPAGIGPVGMGSGRAVRPGAYPGSVGFAGGVSGDGSTQVLVGRDREVGVLLDLPPKVSAGSARVVAVTGSAGIGKSRLVWEGARLAEQHGFRVLFGAGALLQGDLAYAPVVEALRPLVQDSELVNGLPDLGRLFGGLSLPVGPGLGDPGLERTRLFESVRRLLERASERHPIVLLLDDMHWADRASLALLHYVVRGLPAQPLLILLTYRDDEASPALTGLLTDFRRAGTLVGLPLGGLPDSAVAALAADLLGGDAPTELLDMLAGRSGGVPLFVTALVDSLTERRALRRENGGWELAAGVDETVPEVIAELLRARIERLPVDAREVLDLLAVCGATAEHGLLRRVLPEDRLLSGLNTLRAARVVSEEVADARVAYRAAHPLLAEVAYGLLPLVVRRRRHAEVAGALRDESPPRAGLLAQHLRLAGDEVDTADTLEVLCEAAEEALERKAGDEALVHLRAARDLAVRLSRADLVPQLLDQIAGAHELSADRAQTVAAWVAAAEGRSVGPERAERLARASLPEWEAGRLAQYEQLLGQAEAQLVGLPPGPAHARLLAGRAWVALRYGNTGELSAWIEKLDRLYEQSGLPEVRRTALTARCEVGLAAGRYAEVREHLAVGFELAATLGDEVGEAPRRPAFFIELHWGDLAAARAIAEEGLRLARRVGVPTLERAPRIALALAAFFGGEWDEALRRAEAVIELGLRLGMPRGVALGLAVRGLVEVRRGLFDQACASTAEARAALGAHVDGDRHLLGLVEPAEAAAALGRGDPDTAGRVAAASLALGNGMALPMTQSVLAEAHLALGQSDAALTVAGKLSELGPGAPYPGALAAWVRGRAYQDPGLLSRAADELGALGFRYEAAVAALDLAQLTGSPPGDDCAGALEHMGARPQLDRARQLARRLGHRAGPPRPGPGPLSAREEQVARLVADGLTNPQIAARLYLSTRTVTTHLHNIYRRLGVGSRTELTRYVLEQLPRNT